MVKHKYNRPKNENFKQNDKLHYFIISKPYKVLSQFTDENDNPGLGSIYELPKNVYPVGRLDLDSEGLLILTNDRRLNGKLLNPKNTISALLRKFV